MATPPPNPPVCLNCGHPVNAAYCPNCGQKTGAPRVRLGELVADVADEFFKFDSKIVATVVPLLVRPGFLTVEYLRGRRVRYITPFRLYFIVSAIFFFAWTATRTDADTRTQLEANLRAGLQEQFATLGHNAARRRAASGASSPSRSATAESLHASSSRGMTGPTSRRSTSDRLQDALINGTVWFLDNSAGISIAMLPLAALVLKLLYLRVGRMYVEHLVFGVHCSCFMWIVMLPIDFTRGRIQQVYGWVFWTLLAVYVFLAMKRVYGQSLAWTVGKFVAFVIGYFVFLYSFMIGAVICYAMAA